MLLSSFLVVLSIAHALSLPQPCDVFSPRSNEAGVASLEERESPRSSILEKRKGGGGRSSGSSSSGSRSSSSSSTSSSRTSNTGGRTSGGSGVKPTYGGGRYYGGGAEVPYTAGSRSPSGITPFLRPASTVTYFPGTWYYSVYVYPYSHPYNFLNSSAANSTYPNGVNTTLPVDCLCQQYQVCSCDENTDSAFISDLIGNGSYAALNRTLVIVADINSTQTIVINGTLANGTTAASSASALRQGLVQHYSWAVMGALAVYAFMLL